jgi:nucleobase:cation symporter-1, NCS1 family
MVHIAHDDFLSYIKFLFILSFMGPLAGVMCSDYYLVRKGILNVGQLYDPHGLYRYDNGWNWRAFVSFLYVVMFVDQ